MTASLRVGLAGCGRLAELGYAPAVAMCADVRIVALADPDAERRATVAAALSSTGAKRPREHETLEALLAADELDALVVATPPGSHERAARAASAAGVPALVEKPPAPDLDGAARIAALPLPPWIGFNRRFSLGAGLSGAIPAGGAAELELRYRRFSWAPVQVRDPALTDLAPHLIDLALRGGIGEPLAVTARSSRPERVTIELRGRRATARIACACDRPHLERAIFRDSSGRRVRRRTLGGLVSGTLARARRRPHPLVASLAAQLEELALAVRGRPAPNLASAADGVATMAVVAAAAESLALGGEKASIPAAGAAA